MGMNGGYLEIITNPTRLSQLVDGIPKMKKFMIQANPDNTSRVWFGAYVDGLGGAGEVLPDGENGWFYLGPGQPFYYDAIALNPSTDLQWLLQVDWSKVGVASETEGDRLHLVYLD